MFSLAKLHGYPFHPFLLVIMLLLENSFLLCINFAFAFLSTLFVFFKLSKAQNKSNFHIFFKFIKIEIETTRPLLEFLKLNNFTMNLANPNKGPTPHLPCGKNVL
jgi:hypothetical protein